MRQVATIADDRQAKRLADYLLTLGITTRVDPSPSGAVVWVHREEQVDSARREIAEFLAHPDDPRYAGIEQKAEASRREAVRKEKEHFRKTIDLRGRLNAPSARRCPVTYALIGLSIVVGVLTNLGGNTQAIQPFLLSPMSVTFEDRTFDVEDDEHDGQEGLRHVVVRVPTFRSSGLSALARGQVWRLVTPIFLHFGLFHLTFNMMWLYQLGNLIELRKGRLAMLGLGLVAATVSNLGEYFWQIQVRSPLETDPHISFGGMSGVVYALFGYCWMASDYDPDAGIRMPSNTVIWMIGWLILCMTGMVGPIANAAHLMGLGVGMVVGLAPHLLRRSR